MHGTLKNNGRARQGRHNRSRQRQHATYRALIGAELLWGIQPQPKSLADAAAMVGSTPRYVAAMLILLQADAGSLINAVLDDRVQLLAAAKSMRQRAKLIDAFDDSSAIDRKALGEIEGVDKVWDEVIVPNI
jgi:hypothetical protein